MPCSAGGTNYIPSRMIKFLPRRRCFRTAQWLIITSHDLNPTPPPTRRYNCMHKPLPGLDVRIVWQSCQVTTAQTARHRILPWAVSLCFSVFNPHVMDWESSPLDGRKARVAVCYVQACASEATHSRGRCPGNLILYNFRRISNKAVGMVVSQTEAWQQCKILTDSEENVILTLNMQWHTSFDDEKISAAVKCNSLLA